MFELPLRRRYHYSIAIKFKNMIRNYNGIKENFYRIREFPMFCLLYFMQEHLCKRC